MLASRVVAAYGGEERWRSARAVEATFSARGPLLRMKVRHGYDRARVRVDVHEPRVRFAPREWGGMSAVLEGHDVRLEDAGHVLEERRNARRYFPFGRRLLRWDRLDEGYFACYALWNYLAFPALLLRADIEWRDAGPALLEARFPAALPTHSPVQRFHIEPETALVRRHDYTADVIGPFARGAHAILEHATAADIPYASRRLVRPRIAGRAVGPTLIELWIHEYVLSPVGGVL
jgi:hypothetical protein